MVLVYVMFIVFFGSNSFFWGASSASVTLYLFFFLSLSLKKMNLINQTFLYCWNFEPWCSPFLYL